MALDSQTLEDEAAGRAGRCIGEAVGNRGNQRQIFHFSFFISHFPLLNASVIAGEVLRKKFNFLTMTNDR